MTFKESDWMIESTIYQFEKRKLSNPSCCGLFGVCVCFFSFSFLGCTYSCALYLF
jgi:hypothetical protein